MITSFPQCPHHLYYFSSVIIECSVLIVLVFYYKGLLEKVMISLESLIRISRNNWTIEKIWTSAKEFLDILMNLQERIIRNLSVK